MYNADHYDRHDAPEGLWPPVFRAAIFDFDGTIADTASLWREVDLAFLGKRGLPYDEEYPRRLSALGFKGGAMYTISRYGLDEDPDDICDEWNRMGRALYRTRVELRPGAGDYINALRGAGIPVALATTNDEQVLDSMEKVDIRGLFDVRVHGAEVARSKDFPDIYLEAAARMHVPPTECVVFEDIVPGLLSAKEAGMLTCGVLSGDPTQVTSEIRRSADLFLSDWRDIALPASA